jgi:hypothetical protein
LGSGLNQAYTFDGSAYVPRFYVPLKDGRDFQKIATIWELINSKLCYFPNARTQPVIDANFLVVGHRGIFTNDEIFVRKSDFYSEVRAENAAYDNDPRDTFTRLLDKGIEIFAAPAATPNYDDYMLIESRNMDYDLVVDPDGFVHHVLAGWSTEAAVEPSWLQPADLIMIPKAIIGLVRGAGRGVMWMIARRAASRAASRGAARELTEVVLDGFRRNGPMTAEEMDAHVRDVIANRPELARLMGGAGLDGEPLRRQMLHALEDW